MFLLCSSAIGRRTVPSFVARCWRCSSAVRTACEPSWRRSRSDKSPPSLLTAVLDPNQAVEARYVSYLATTKNGLTFTGILASETGASITLIGTEGKPQTILRKDLEELTSTGKSLMPEGLEKELQPQDLADLIAFIRANVPPPQRKTFEGNKPELKIGRA